MKSFKESVLLDEAKARPKVIVVYGGGFQPFHAGHLSSYTQAKAKFKTPDFYVASSNDTKVRPIPFKDKEFLAQQAGVTDDFVQVVQPINPEEIMKKYDEKKDILILVRSERDPMKYTKKDGSPAYYQPFVSIDKCESFETHAYIFVTKKHDFKVNGKEAFSGSQIRKMYAEADSEGRDNIIDDLYPKARNKAKVKKLLDKYIGGGMNEELEQQDEAVLGYAQRRQRAQQFKRIQKRLIRARALQAKRFADPKRLKRRAAKMAYQFFRGRLAGGKNYADLSTGEKITVDTRLQKMLPAIRKFAVRLVPAARSKEIMRKQHAMMTRKEDLNHIFAEFIVEKPTLPQDKDVAKKDGTQPKKYYVGLDKDTKDARASHFARTGPKSDSDKSAYKDAPGDKEAREKGMPQSKHTLKFKQMYGEAVKTPEDRKEISRLDQLVRLGLADTKSLAVIKRSVEKLKSGDMLNPSERNVTNDLLTTLLDMVTSSDALFRMTKTQLQKEAYLKCNYTPEGTMCEQHGMKDCSMSEASYKGNIGAMEMMKFFQVATPDEKQKLKKLIADKNQSAAWKMIQDVTGMKLMGEEDEYDDSDYDETDGLSMAQIEVSNMIQDAEELLDMMEQMDEEPDAWVLSKITKAADYVSTVRDYLEFEDDFDYEDDEEEGEEDDGEFTGSELDMYASEMEPDDFGDAYEEFKPILEEIEGLKKKAEKSGIAYSILKAVYDRGMAAWQGGHRPGTTPQQWAFARVNSFITKGKGTWGKADKDLAAKVNKNEEFSKFAEALEWGTDELRKKYAADTPGQSTEIQKADHQACCDDCIEEGSDGSTCWDGYKQVGTKMKNGKSVPNCVPVDEEIAEEVDWEQVVNEAEYQGKSVKLNDPFRTPDGPKKFGVYTMGPNGKVVIVRFGDPNMEIKRDDPERRASFRARHGCDNPGPKWKANYWSCYQWRAGSKVDS
jgi:hypothetical protein